jgi:hypothetical protein
LTFEEKNFIWETRSVKMKYLILQSSVCGNVVTVANSLTSWLAISLKNMPLKGESDYST